MVGYFGTSPIRSQRAPNRRLKQVRALHTCGLNRVDPVREIRYQRVMNRDHCFDIEHLDFPVVTYIFPDKRLERFDCLYA